MTATHATAKEIRRHFTDYFAHHDHAALPSSSLVPRNDPSLLFTSAGMVQFKNIFTGLEKPAHPRAVTVQKCLRAGGKHNDLENVGYTTRHHTFFEMMGNFSFGDYFKELAIPLAWDLITKEWGVDAERLLISVYAEDDEAFKIWKKVTGFADSKIIRIATDDNFWAMGDTGPCGPCAEIFYDYGADFAGGPPGAPDEGGDRFVEIWNLVFMQYERDPDGQHPLPKPCIDTGIGLERISALLQGSHDNFDSDLFTPLIGKVADLSGVETEATDNGGVSHRVISDHLRASAFLIAEGVLPSNEGRGYVLRRILRRAMRHIRLLGREEPLLYRLVPTLIAEMGEAYSELGRAEALITDTLQNEESRFGETLARGLKVLESETDKLGAGELLSGEAAFRLYDTYGFPLDLTQDILRGQNRTVDTQGFDAAMAAQRAAGRAAWGGSGEEATSAIWLELSEQLGASEFLGYETERAEAMVARLLRDGAPLDQAKAGESCEFICNQTPFYGESGGQEGDRGTAKGTAPDSDLKLTITDTQKRGAGLHLHKAEVVSGSLREGDTLEMQVNTERRARLRSHHSATHLLHEALRRVLGDHVTQQGSLVAEDRLRFDFSHPKPVSKEQLEAIEDEVNYNIRANRAVQTRLMQPEEAVEKAGALALFGEKYGDEVRVVSMGDSDSAKPAGYFSTELCGGTHVKRTGDIGLMHIIKEESLAAGVRRITAVADQAALDYLREQESRVTEVADIFTSSREEITARAVTLTEENKTLKRDLEKARRDLVAEVHERAEEQIELGWHESAIQYLDRAISLDDKKTHLQIEKAEIHLGAGEYEEAIESLSQAISSEKKSPVLYSERAHALTQVKRYDLAIADYNEALLLEKSNPNLYFNRGVLHEKQKEYDHAFGDYNKAISLDRSQPAFYLARGQLYSGMGDHDQAIEDFNETIKLGKNERNEMSHESFNAYVMRASAYFSKGEYDSTIAEVNSLIPEEGHKEEMLYALRGAAYRNTGEYELAIVDFAKAISLDPNKGDFYIYLEKAKAERDKKGKAIGNFRFVAKNLKDASTTGLRAEADKIKGNLGSGVAVLVSANDGRASLVVSVTEDLTPRISAIDLVRRGSEALGGTGGGGRDDFAQGGGPDASGAEQALEAIESALQEAAKETAA